MNIRRITLYSVMLKRVRQLLKNLNHCGFEKFSSQLCISIFIKNS